MRMIGLAVFLLFSLPAWADAFSQAVEGLEQREGLFDLYVDPQAGKVLAALPAGATQRRYLYKAYVARGLGSNPVGLDRTAPGPSYVVAWQRFGPTLVLTAENWRYRASGTAAEKRAVAQSFAQSHLFAAEILAEREDGRLLIDVTPLLLSDPVGLAQRLKDTGQGSFSPSKDLSVLDPAAQLAFPENVELEALITLTGAEPGREVRETAPEPRAITLGLHHSFLALPDDGFTPRRWDPRAGAIGPVAFADYSAELDADLVTRYAIRHRLEKRDPSAKLSEVEEPIVYYLDPATPEPVRKALIDGASWWAEAFEAAGFKNAFRVEILPEDAHPLDARYNVISWVHRQTRGWSYGPSFVDPRTGEILKAHVVLGSLRVRQDRLIFEALSAKRKNKTGAPDDPTRLALARLRQLSAHEVGHTLGLAHNFAASSYGRASVMDYPAPMLRIGDGGQIDFSDAYAEGMGAWDDFAIRWLYAPAPEGVAEADFLESLIQAAHANGLLYISDAHARSPGASHAEASLWDNGADPVAELQTVLAVRAAGLKNFGRHVVGPEADQSDLRNALVPLYLYHRYQVQAAAKLIGGLKFSYKLAGDTGRPDALPVNAREQRRAMQALILTLQPAILALEPRLVDLMAPRASRPLDYPVDRESFDSYAGAAFDPLSAAEAAAGITLQALLHPDRLYRLFAQHNRSDVLPGVEEVLLALDEALLPPERNSREDEAALRWRVAARFVQELLQVSLNDRAAPEVRALVDSYLGQAQRRLNRQNHAMASWLHDQIDRHRSRPATPASAPAGVAVPPGSPIGAGPR